MSGTTPGEDHIPASPRAPSYLLTRERLKMIRENAKAKRDAVRAAVSSGQSPSPRKVSPSGSPMKRQTSQQSAGRMSPYPAVEERRRSGTPLGNDSPSVEDSFARTFALTEAGPDRWKNISGVGDPTPNTAMSQTAQDQISYQREEEPKSPRPSRTFAQIEAENHNLERLSGSGDSPQDPATPQAIPDKLPYQREDEPDRIEVQPLLFTEIPLPVRNTQSVPHTPTNPSRLSMHQEVSPPRTITLNVREMGPMEFIVPLSMQPRIVSQYLDTVNYYPTALGKNLKERDIPLEVLDQLNVLLCRLSNVTTHIGLEGGGPSSQEEVVDEQEALYAEMSSEKFAFLSCLFSCLKDYDFHLALIARPGQLLDIVETFLKGKEVSYERTDAPSNSGPRALSTRLKVGLISSGEQGYGARRPQLMVALDESFDAKDPHIIHSRNQFPSSDELVPVIRPIVYSSVEHLHLCLPRTLKLVDRIRKLAFCVWHTQRIIGQVELDDQPATTVSDYAKEILTFLQNGAISANWRLPKISPIVFTPTMDSDSSLSDAMSNPSDIFDSDTAINSHASSAQTRGDLQASKYFPNQIPSSASASTLPSVAGGKRPFDLEYGDSFETQAKKQKMVARVRKGLPMEEPLTQKNAQHATQEGKKREKALLERIEFLQKDNKSHAEWAERRQKDFEELRDKANNWYAETVELNASLEQTQSRREKDRATILNLQDERGILKNEISDLRDQLLNHPLPAVAAAAREAERIRILETEITTLKKKNKNLISESETIHGVYQQASTAAAELTAELEELKYRQPEIDRLKAENQFMCKQINYGDGALRKELESLRATVKSRDKLVYRKEEEIAQLKRGRGGVQTRGSSAQPRSPRGGSRNASPAAGLLMGAGVGAKALSGLGARFNLDG